MLLTGLLRRFKLVCVVLLTLTVVGCSAELDKEQAPIVSEPTSESQVKKSVWVTYWDTAYLQEEIVLWQEDIQQINYFAAYFDQDNRIFIPDEIKETKAWIDKDYEQASWKAYMTVVNDKVYSDSSSSLKDTQLLHQLFLDDEAMEAHIIEIIRIAVEEGFDGIEIDYEGIKEDEVLWNKHLVFIEKLYKKAQQCGLEVRILLEPRTPVETLKFPQGPEYIMMCYNLHGYGSVPGPKANGIFLEDMVEKMRQVSENRGYALATGGFDFSEDGTVVALTQQQAETCLSQNKSQVRRDKESGSQVFSYKDQDNNLHEVWYADQVTLDYWEAVLQEQGEQNISIWRLGGTIK